MTEDSYNYPTLIMHKGTGYFFTERTKFESEFEIIHYPQNTSINANFSGNPEIIKDFINKKKWELCGKISSGENVSIADLHLSNIHGNSLIFHPFGEIIFGDKKPETYLRADFPLIGLYENPFKIDIDNWVIKVHGNTDLAIIEKNKSKNWNTPCEGLMLSLEYNAAPINDFLSKANDICLLLSLALGSDIMFNRQLYQSENSEIEIWRRKVDGNLSSRPCVTDPSYFLQNSLPIFEKWDKKKKDIFSIVINYINSADNGFLEHRILGLCTAWESLAINWGNKKKEKDEYLLILKDSINTIIDDLDNQGKHDKNFIKTRISSALDWKKLNDKLLGLLDSYSLDVNKLDVDFKTLIKIRNDVAHTGKFQKNYTKEILVNLISKNKLALQVLLLKELHYDKSVFCEKDQWKSVIDILEFNK